MSNEDYRFVFFGTPRFAVHVLTSLEREGFVPAAVVTAPDRPAGRGQKLTPSPVKVWALERGIDVLTPETLTRASEIAELANSEWDFFVVAAYGKLIRANVLGIPEHGVLNVHPSLLPKFRGPSPVLSVVLADERNTGVSIMLLDEEIDHGPIVAQASVTIAPEDWPMRTSSLEDLLAVEGGNLLAEVIPDFVDDEITLEEQNHSEATGTRKYTDADALIDLSGGAYQNLLKIRAFDTNPRAYFLTAAGKRVIITEAEMKDGALEILSVIPEGKKEMSYQEFLQGHHS